MTKIKQTKIVYGVRYLEVVNTTLSCTSCAADHDTQLCHKLCGRNPTEGFWLEYTDLHKPDSGNNTNSNWVECYA